MERFLLASSYVIPKPNHYSFCLFPVRERNELLGICEKQVKALYGQTVGDGIIIRYLNIPDWSHLPFLKGPLFLSNGELNGVKLC